MFHGSGFRRRGVLLRRGDRSSASASAGCDADHDGRASDAVLLGLRRLGVVQVQVVVRLHVELHGLVRRHAQASASAGGRGGGRAGEGHGTDGHTSAGGSLAVRGRAGGDRRRRRARRELFQGEGTAAAVVLAVLRFDLLRQRECVQLEGLGLGLRVLAFGPALKRENSEIVRY